MQIMVNGATVANLKPDFIDLHCGTPLCCCCQLLGVLDFVSVDAMFCGSCHVFAKQIVTPAHPISKFPANFE